MLSACVEYITVLRMLMRGAWDGDITTDLTIMWLGCQLFSESSGFCHCTQHLTRLTKQYNARAESHREMFFDEACMSLPIGTEQS